ncbi:P-loop NTPase family protein [Siccirubricoccus phaeus]|uniref:hypothetical protein n=1 Tax=Siccirubricoccus phaeus TaxID=2595053 RepID=UPI00165C589A|nr:hypothetical protein [Siccirubricoccus phaeus]
MEALLAQLHLEHRAATRSAKLPYSDRLELGPALATEPRIMLLRARRRQWLTVALGISSRVLVMGHGQIVHAGRPAELRENAEIQRRWLAVSGVARQANGPRGLGLARQHRYGAARRAPPGALGCCIGWVPWCQGCGLPQNFLIAPRRAARRLRKNSGLTYVPIV